MKWQKPVAGKGIHQANFLKSLSKVIDEHTTITLDIGDNAVWAAHFLRLSGQQRVLVSANIGVMGFALPAAIAAKLEQPDHKVFALAGDGGFQMTIQELGTAVQLGLEIIIVVFANGILARVQAEQKNPFGTDIVNPDFEAVARAYGCDAATISTENEIEAALKKALAHKGSPFLIQVNCDPHVLAPMSKWQDGFIPVHFS